MANVKFVAVSRGLKGIIDYVTNKEKTIDKYISGVNCVAETAVYEFECVKKQFHKTDGRSYYHIVQAFSPDDPVDFETAHKIGLEFAAHFKGYQCIVATHMNTAHKHNHIIMNSVNFETGAKFHQSAGEMKQVKEFNNNLCRKYGLSITEAKADPFSIPKWKTQLKDTIRKAMENSNTRDEFICYMRAHNYEVKWEPNHKYITYTTPDNIRCRDNKLFDQALLRGNMELYFAMGGADYHVQQVQNARVYGEPSPSLDDTIFSTAAVIDAWLSDDGDKFHLETLHRSNKEIEKLARLGRKIEQIVYAVKDEDDSEQIDNARALYQASLILGDLLYEEQKRKQSYDEYYEEESDMDSAEFLQNTDPDLQQYYYDFDDEEELEEEMDEEYEQYHGFGGMTMGGM